MSSLELVVVPAAEEHTATVLFLHGLGDSGVGWLFLAEAIAPMLPHVKWILPNAPMLALSANDNMPVPAWFDVPSFDKPSNGSTMDEKGMMASVDAINQIIEAEMKTGIPSERIVVGGFSQGCVISLLTGFHTRHKLAGVLGCSGWLGVITQGVEKTGSGINKETPFLICHGDQDEVVKPKYGQASAKYLTKCGYKAAFKLYQTLGHAASPEEIADIAVFLKAQLPPSTTPAVASKL
ncbi:Phospholipase/carboxylesterase/thioesterase [Dichotomocladium elegans]|nr:Phospholipase/carboxylesterase/thioesterase [Dichotomocladium elegans]